MTKLRELRRKSVGAVLNGVEANGLPGLTTAVYRMIGENQPSIDCLRQADIELRGHKPQTKCGTPHLLWPTV